MDTHALTPAPTDRLRVRLTDDGGIGRLTWSRPPRNALPHPVFVDLEQLQALLAEPGLKALVVQGEGQHFCAGADLEALAEQLAASAELAASLDRGKAVLTALAMAPVPVVALIRGCCLGAGLEIALACHFRIAARSAMFGFPEVEQGLLPGFGGTVFGRESMSGATMVELMLSGRLVGAPEAIGLGLVDRVVPGRELASEVDGFVQSLTAGRPPELIRTVMTAIHGGRRLPLEEALRRETELFRQVAQRGGRGDE